MKKLLNTFLVLLVIGLLALIMRFHTIWTEALGFHVVTKVELLSFQDPFVGKATISKTYAQLLRNHPGLLQRLLEEKLVVFEKPRIETLKDVDLLNCRWRNVGQPENGKFFIQLDGELQFVGQQAIFEKDLRLTVFFYGSDGQTLLEEVVPLTEAGNLALLQDDVASFSMSHVFEEKPVDCLVRVDYGVAVVESPPAMRLQAIGPSTGGAQLKGHLPASGQAPVQLVKGSKSTQIVAPFTLLAPISEDGAEPNPESEEAGQQPGLLLKGSDDSWNTVSLEQDSALLLLDEKELWNVFSAEGESPTELKHREARTTGSDDRIQEGTVELPGPALLWSGSGAEKGPLSLCVVHEKDGNTVLSLGLQGRRGFTWSQAAEQLDVPTDLACQVRDGQAWILLEQPSGLQLLETAELGRDTTWTQNTLDVPGWEAASKMLDFQVDTSGTAHVLAESSPDGPVHLMSRPTEGESQAWELGSWSDAYLLLSSRGAPHVLTRSAEDGALSMLSPAYERQAAPPVEELPTEESPEAESQEDENSTEAMEEESPEEEAAAPPAVVYNLVYGKPMALTQPFAVAPLKTGQGGLAVGCGRCGSRAFENAFHAVYLDEEQGLWRLLGIDQEAVEKP